MTHDELKDLVPVFALDALSPPEEGELVAHLKVCTECSRMLAYHRETAGMLAFAAGSVQAPADLRDRILSRAAADRRIDTAPVQVRSPGTRRSGQWRWQWAGLAAACLLALVVGGVGFLRLDGQTDRLTEQQTIIARQREALDLISSPDSTVLAMAPTGESAGVYGKAFVSEEEESAAVVVSGLAPPGEGVYTLWLIDDGQPRPVSDFVPDDGLALVPVDRAVEEDATLAVTREPNAGNTSPQGPIILAARRA